MPGKLPAAARLCYRFPEGSPEGNNKTMSLKLRGALIVVIGTVLGLTVSIGSSMLAERKAVPAAVAHADAVDENMALLAEAMQRVRREYVDKIDDRVLVENAIRGMLEGLDQHSSYLDTEQYEDIRIATTGNYSGVGMNVSLRNGQVMVDTPFDNAPAAEAGIQSGDVVLAVDDIPVGSGGLEAAINRMRGEPGTQVTLSVRRDDGEPVNFTLTRASIHVDTVSSEYLPGGYGYIRLSGFSDSTIDELEYAAEQFSADQDNRLNGLVLDLRNNPGGVLQAAVGVADAFLDEGLIVRGNGRIRQARFEQYARSGDLLESVPMVVLINSGSASGSEIVAGALKDHDRAELFGDRTYGKGSVQSVVPIGSGSALKLTTAHYLTPHGTRINGLGIEPHRSVEHSSNPADQYRGPGSRVSISQDAQLSEALEYLGYEAIELSQAQ